MSHDISAALHTIILTSYILVSHLINVTFSSTDSWPNQCSSQYIWHLFRSKNNHFQPIQNFVCGAPAGVHYTVREKSVVQSVSYIPKNWWNNSVLRVSNTARDDALVTAGGSLLQTCEAATAKAWSLIVAGCRTEPHQSPCIARWPNNADRGHSDTGR